MSKYQSTSLAFVFLVITIGLFYLACVALWYATTTKVFGPFDLFVGLLVFLNAIALFLGACCTGHMCLSFVRDLFDKRRY